MFAYTCVDVCIKLLNLKLIQKLSPTVVTGSTDGIGRAYAEELARRGINLVLISRNHDKLSVVASHLVEVRIIAADFSLGPSIYEEIERQLSTVPVGILVNNVGSQYSYPMYVGEVPTNEIWSILNVNMGATVMMTRMILEGMRQRGRGAIVNISSGSELQPLPFMTVYAASKTFVKNFSAALRYEYSDDGITVQHLSPLFVNTKMNAFSYRLQKSSLFVPDAVTYARNAYWCSEIPPEWMRTYIGGLMNKGFRRDYFKGQANRSMK
ncbi:hypothetical protein B566_EDAN015065 [Ephemera danica]|nr:hypothetical protein B566_EDAN015065 [Ephemera danica]